MVTQSPDLEAMIDVVASFFKVDKVWAENMVYWAQKELKLNEIPKDHNNLYEFGLRLTEVLGPEGLNGGTKQYVENFLTKYQLNRVLYNLKNT